MGVDKYEQTFSIAAASLRSVVDNPPVSSERQERKSSILDTRQIEKFCFFTVTGE